MLLRYLQNYFKIGLEVGASVYMDTELMVKFKMPIQAYMEENYTSEISEVQNQLDLTTHF